MRQLVKCALASACAIVAVLALGPAVAGAEVRSGAVSDGRDVPEALSGGRQPDIEQVRVSYDTAGTLAVTVRLHEPFAQTNGTYSYFETSIRLGPGYARECNSFDGAYVTLYGRITDSPWAKLRMSTYDGELSPTKTVSADKREITYTTTASQLAGRDYICAGESRLYEPDEYGHCAPSSYNCRYIAYSYTGDTASHFFFDGFAPAIPACDDDVDNEGDGKADLEDPDCKSDRQGTSEGAPPPLCRNQRDDDGDGLLDRQDPGCQGDAERTTEDDSAPVASSFAFRRLRANRACRLDLAVEVLPDLTPKKLFPFEKVIISVRGLSGAGRKYRATRELPLAADPGYLFKLKPGRYLVSGRYPGDRFRQPSRTSKRKVDVCTKRKP